MSAEDQTPDSRPPALAVNQDVEGHVTAQLTDKELDEILSRAAQIEREQHTDEAFANNVQQLISSRDTRRARASAAPRGALRLLRLLPFAAALIAAWVAWPLFDLAAIQIATQRVLQSSQHSLPLFGLSVPLLLAGVGLLWSSVSD